MEEKKQYKARLVVKGFEQNKGIDFDEIFSPILKITSIRIILSLVAVEYFPLEQLDVKTYFIHGHMMCFLQRKKLCPKTS